MMWCEQRKIHGFLKNKILYELYSSADVSKVYAVGNQPKKKEFK